MMVTSELKMMSRINIIASDVPLKPCPFCGAREVNLMEVLDFADEEDAYYVACGCCNANQLPDSKERAIHDWNQREMPDSDVAIEA